MLRKKTLRLIDANLNRAKEGLRVCEDVLRFLYNDRSLTESFKKLRHDCSKIILEFPVPYRALVEARSVGQDVGKKSVILEKQKPGWKDVAVSNLKRSEESLRVLEEASKIIAPRTARRFQALRFKLYELEKRMLQKF
ncbi:MAG: thiamine-phosphate pyrophosphorylase [Candidatus Omnitrophica bacterium]|nr:thiamine-phosphate pyrophosphorylase [Candidatus Omnitrophota bacterium]